MLNTTDLYKSRQELLEAFTRHISQEKYSYYLKETPKQIKLICKGKSSFYCEAQIIAMYRKREAAYQIKRIKSLHKCPMPYHSNKNYLKEEFSKLGQFSSIPELISKTPLKISYLAAWKVLNDKPDTNFICKEPVGDEIRKYLFESNQGYYLEEENEVCDELPEIYSEALFSLKNDFLTKNPSAICFITGSYKEELENNSNLEKKLKKDLQSFDLFTLEASFYFAYPKLLNLLRNIIDIKIYLRRRGCVIFGCGYDPFDKPIIVSGLVSELDIKESLEIFFNFEKELRKQVSYEIIYFVDYELPIIKKLLELKVNFFIKTRSILKGFMKNDLEKLFNSINYGTNILTEMQEIDPKHYLISMNPPLFGLNNFGEMDVDFIFYSVYNANYIDCILAIIKSISDHTNELINRAKTSKFGTNVLFRIEKNMKNKVKDENKVNLEEMTCDCGRFQMLMIPCKHVCAIVENPLDFVSNYYNLEMFKELEMFNCIMDLYVRFSADRYLLRKGPGRPKKLPLESDI